MTRFKEEKYDQSYAQWFKSNGITIRVLTQAPWDELEQRMRDFYTERAEEYFRVRHHTDLGRVEL